MPNPYAAVDRKMAALPDSTTRSVASLARYINATFTTEDDKARAAFGWVARSIRYDVANRYNFFYAQVPADLVHETLAQRVGVCTNYAELYCTLTKASGLSSYVITGGTKHRDGTPAAIGHAWCATRLHGQWYLMDPTWAAGYVVEETFVPRLDNSFYKVSPAVLIRTHLPFDPMWQLLTTPYTAQQFQQGKAPSVAAQPPFSFADSVAAYEQQDLPTQLRATRRRVERNGVKNDLTFNQVLHLKQQEDNYFISRYNEALEAANAGNEKLNTFISYFNRQFQPPRPDAELASLLLPAQADFMHARALLASLGSPLPEVIRQARSGQLLDFVQQCESRLQESQAFVAKYLQTRKLFRPLLFRGSGGEYLTR
ncbi:transglutaminase domain-containing protein [Hymenobacter sp. BRD67]|uniref:transglutaminase domain-containing protein n=1 Tax=Hymenobacter sp. BRD67 TaxID=2675877 RepID=UPI001564E0E0|nr:transglutaminase domain-containing protein [Hymenobacter sp. BRD67]QKG54255.1 hypothetical protein GKZ67_18710 [Hymenobacter sp. BRD67]